MTRLDATDEAAAAAVLDFWLVEVGRGRWFDTDAALDAVCRRRFAAAMTLAAAGSLDRWAADRAGALALVILLDQLPRNAFRGRARAFAADPQARRIADAAVEQGFDRATPPPERLLFYLPFEHSEALADQDRAVALIDAHLPDAAEERRHARLHRDVIAEFGRFPHRNAVLGRRSTPDEIAYLTAGGYAPGGQQTEVSSDGL